MPKPGDLQVWWMPSLGGPTFHIPVSGPTEAVRLLAVLAAYDDFRVAAGMEPDYSNCGGLEVYEKDPEAPGGYDWSDWESEDFDDISTWGRDAGDLMFSEIKEANDA